MSTVAQELELTVAEGLLGALDTARGLETARALLKDDGLDEAAARSRLEHMLKGDAGTCRVCGHEHGGKAKCPECGALQQLKEADGVADLPEGTANALPRELPKRKRKRKKGARKVEEATVIGNGATPGDPNTQTATPWGGVPFGSLEVGTNARGRGRRERDFQPRRGSGQVDAALMPAEKFTEPPNLRDADGWDRCGNCVFFGHGLCNLYGWDRPEVDVVHRAAYPVDRDDLCDSHTTLSQRVGRLVESLDREDERLAEAARAENGSMVARSRARVRRAEELLSEAIDADLEEMWSDASRAAAIVARREHLVNGGHHHQDKFGSTILDRDKGESALHYAVRRLSNKPPKAGKVAADAKALYGKPDLRGTSHASLRRPPNSLVHAAVDESRELIREVASDAYPGLDRSPKKNWVDKAGGLPRYIERIAKHLHYEKGKDIGHAIAIAVNAVKKMCAAGDTNFPGKQNVNAKSRAEACAAVAEWERKKGKSKVKEAALEEAAWDDFEVALGLWEAAHRPIPPSDRFIENLNRELALAEGGADWMLGLAALDEADALLERYGPVLEENEMVVTLDESGIVTLYHQIAGFHGKWDPLKHPRTARGRKGGGQFGRRHAVLAQIEGVAQRGAGVGSRDKQRGYRHPEGASAGERMVAEMFDKPGRDLTIMPAERKMLGSYLRRRGNVSLAQKLENDKTRMIHPDLAAELARHIRGQGSTKTIYEEPTMGKASGEIGRRGMPPTLGRGRSRPSGGGTGQGGSESAGRAAEDITSVEDAFKHDSVGAVAGRRNTPSGLDVDNAISKVLQSFPGLKDWSVQKVGENYDVHVEMPDGNHVIRVDPTGKVDYQSGPQKATAPKIKAKKTVKLEPQGAASPLETQVAVSSHVPSSYEGTGEWSKPYHMQPGDKFVGKDGVLYEHLSSGKDIMQGKKGPLAASHVKNHKTGTSKLIPAFVQQEYEVVVPKGTAKPKPAAPAASSNLAGDLMKSVGLAGGKFGDSSELKGKNVVITGTIPGMTRGEAHARLAAIGAHPQSSVTNATHVLIVGENAGKAKPAAAQKKGVTVIAHHDVQALQENAEEGEMDDVQRLRAVEARLAEATDTSEVVRLRARRDALTGRLEESPLSAEKRKNLPGSAFALPGGRYPIHDESHARNALSRVAQHGTPDEKAKVKAAVKRRYPNIGD